MNLLPKDGEAIFFPSFFTKDESNSYFNLLIKDINWKQEPVIIFGKEIMQPRLTAWYGDEGKAYRYSGITMHPRIWIKPLLEIKNKIETAAGVKFNSALLNQYRDGKDSMGWHRDNEKELGANPVIGSVSFGAMRKFMFRHYEDKSLNQSIDLLNGSLLLMRGETQHCWHHSIPKTAQPVDVRINITFRTIIEY